MRLIKPFLVLLVVFAFCGSASAIPIVHENGYTVELVASGLGAADGVEIAPSGDIFVSDYQGGNVFRVDGSTHSVSTYASGFSYSTDLAIHSAGSIFVTSGAGNPRDIMQVYPDGSSSLFATGLLYTVGLELGPDGALYTGNSGDGTISRIDPSGAVSTYASGFGGPHGPFGLSFDPLGNLYLVQHGTGEVHKIAPDGTVSLVAHLTPFGPTFIEAAADGSLFVGDSLNASVYRITESTVRLFASDFYGKSNPPGLGPSGLAIDSLGNMYVADRSSLWKISAEPVPEPTTVLLLGSGLAGLVFARKKSS